MKLEEFFNAVVGSREGEFKPDFDNDISEKELLSSCDEEYREKEKRLREWRDKTTPVSLQEGKEKSLKSLNEGCNKAVFVEFMNGEKGVFKSSEGEDKELRHHTEPGTFYKRERAAYLVDRFFDFGIVPPTVIKKIRGETGSLQNFIPDTTPYWEIRNFEIIQEKESQNQLKTLWIFDIFIHNSDRHDGNLLFSGLHDESSPNPVLHAIDNGCSFSNEPYTWPNDFSDQELPEELIVKVEQFLKNERSQEVLKELLLELLPESEVDAFFERVKKFGKILVENKKIPISERRNVTKF